MKHHEKPSHISQSFQLQKLQTWCQHMSILDFPNLGFADFPAKLYHQRVTTASPKRPVAPLGFPRWPQLRLEAVCADPWCRWGVPARLGQWRDPRGSAEEGEFHRFTPELDRKSRDMDGFCTSNHYLFSISSTTKKSHYGKSKGLNLKIANIILISDQIGILSSFFSS